MESKLKNGKQLHILLGDDDKDDRFFFAKALKELPIATDLTMVEDGEKLMKYLMENSKKLPDFIFLDLNMPRKSGSECLYEIKQNINLQHIPVIIYSTSLHEDAVDLLYHEGAHYYIQKCDFEEQSRVLHKTLTMLINDPKRPGRDEFIINTPYI